MDILHRTYRHRVCALALLLLLIGALPAVASEGFLVSAVEGTNIVLTTYELDHNQISTKRSSRIETGNYIYSTAVAFRQPDNTVLFDVYFGVCHDLECADSTLSMIRLDSNLNLVVRKDFPIPVAYELATETLQSPSGRAGLSLLIKSYSTLEERELGKDGTPGPPVTVAFPGIYGASVAEDGKMIAGYTGNSIRVRTFHPNGPIRTKRTTGLPQSAVLSESIIGARPSRLAGALPETYRFLFFRVFRDISTTEANLQSQILMQKVADSTGKFIGPARIFREFKAARFYDFGESIAVAPHADAVFFTELDTSCNKKVMKAQAINPQSGMNVGPAQLLIGCSQLSYRSAGISGIDVIQFR